MAQVEFLADRSEPVGAEAGSVVGHDPGESDATGGVPGNQASKEGRCGGRSLVGQDLGISQARSIIDGHVDELPAGTLAALAMVPGDAVTDRLDAGQLFGVDMDDL